MRVGACVLASVPLLLGAVVLAAPSELPQAVVQAKVARDRAIEQANEAYRTALKKELDKATRAADLDLANRIKAEIDATTSDAVTWPNLRESLPGTTWQWAGGGEVTFGAEGLMKHPEWDQRGLVTRWEVIDRGTVLLRIEKGRADDLYAVLLFGDGGKSFTGHGFNGAPLGRSTRIR